MGLTATTARERERAVQTQPFPQPMGEKQDCERTECMAWLVVLERPHFSQRQSQSPIVIRLTNNLQSGAHCSVHPKVISMDYVKGITRTKHNRQLDALQTQFFFHEPANRIRA